MTITLQLPPHVERQLRARAAGKGLELSDFVAEELRQIAEAPLSTDLETELPSGEDAAPWRGVFAVTAERAELFPGGLTLPGGTLPAWTPEIVLDPSRYQDDE
jgi:hypothetical protein